MKWLIRGLLLISLLVPMLFSCSSFFQNTSATHSPELICLFNNYSGEIRFSDKEGAEKEGVSFRVKNCGKHRCKNWCKWDWMNKGSNRIYEVESDYYLEVQWNANFKGYVRTMRLEPRTTPEDRSCQEINSWYFRSSSKQLIHLFSEME
ncbi:MAG: hypothetical protein F6K65_31860 [Moorea sp. SIO3C2]|nr:hypothetical protein [Moorena sp. SIO3C2]